MRLGSTILLAVLPLLGGCIVTKGRHELVLVQLEATRAALNARQGQCQMDLNDRSSTIQRLQSEIGRRQSQLDTLDVRIEHLKHDNEQLLADRSVWLTTPPECPVAPPTDDPVTPAPAPWIAAELDTTLTAMRHYAEHEYAAEQREFHRSTAKDKLSELVEGGYAEVLDVHESTVIRIPARKLFSEGRVSLSPRGREITKTVRAALVEMPEFVVQVRGHTDDHPFHSAEHQSNWELGFARAVTVVRSLNVADLPNRPSAASFADTQPIGDNNTEEGRRKNSRIEIWLTPDPDLETLYATSPLDEEPEEEPEQPEDEPEELPDEEGGTAKEE